MSMMILVMLLVGGVGVVDDVDVEVGVVCGGVLVEIGVDAFVVNCVDIHVEMMLLFIFMLMLMMLMVL